MFRSAMLRFVICIGAISTNTQAQSTEEKFQDVFITAGYATAFGAALGAASLSFFDNPQDHLQFIAIGASLGFITGSALGSYVVLAPMASTEAPGSTNLAGVEAPVLLRPVFSTQNSRLLQVEGMIQLASF